MRILYGTRLREARLALRLSQDELADLAGVSQRVVWDLERSPDEVPNVSLNRAEAVTQAIRQAIQNQRTELDKLEAELAVA